MNHRSRNKVVMMIFVLMIVIIVNLCGSKSESRCYFIQKLGNKMAINNEKDVGKGHKHQISIFGWIPPSSSPSMRHNCVRTTHRKILP